MTLRSILAENKGIGDFDPPDLPDDEPDTELEIPRLVWRRERYGEGVRLVSVGEAACDVQHTHYWPSHWLNLLSIGQIIATPCFLYGTDFRTIERVRP